MPPDPPDIAGEMSFLPKLSRLLETLLMLSGAVLGLGPELEREIKPVHYLHLCFVYLQSRVTLSAKRASHITSRSWSGNSRPNNSRTHRLQDGDGQTEGNGVLDAVDFGHYGNRRPRVLGPGERDAGQHLVLTLEQQIVLENHGSAVSIS
ncbi:hypothetical protein EYF80_017632 [Liparis tanakae]|uniref:Uncharacterized protein n=1 Tax=Liparis tanakae TaxID=230148 RepID=A0A4Z2I4H1_9TELE|nr:hypothetical protein EYF80_017632 [Liparis tanakae]